MFLIHLINFSFTNNESFKGFFFLNFPEGLLRETLVTKTMFLFHDLVGLKRTGKSCRLRWLNYLRPDLRRGNITPEEQLLIMELHAKWGNRLASCYDYCICIVLLIIYIYKQKQEYKIL
jgi:hypothetical protein